MSIILRVFPVDLLLGFACCGLFVFIPCLFLSLMLVEASGEGVPYAFRRLVGETSRLFSEFEGLVGMPVLLVIMLVRR